MTTEKNDQFNFWGINGETNQDPWDTLHAYFQKQARRDDAVVEEERVTGTAKS